MHVSWHLDYLRPHPIHTQQQHTRTKPSVSTRHADTLSPRREHINGTQSAGRGARSKCSCLSLDSHCRTRCSLGRHAPTVILLHWLSTNLNVPQWTQNLFPAGRAACVLSGAINHQSTKWCMIMISTGPSLLKIQDRLRGFSSHAPYLMLNW